MKMSDKKLIILFIAVVLILSACGDTVEPGDNNPSQSKEEPKTGSAIPDDLPIPDDAEPAPDDALTLPQFDPFDSITYVGSYPVSFLVEGEQQLVGDFGAEIYWVAARESISAVVKNAPSPQSGGLTITEVPYKTYGAFQTIASSGEWDFFPVDVRYESYTLDKQPDKMEWSAHFRSISSIPEDMPVIFTEAWIFDWNNDGIEWAFVIASNVIDHYPAKENVLPNPPPSINVDFYTLSALFIEGKEPILSMKESWSIFTEPLYENESIYNTYLPPLEGVERGYSVDYSLIQFDSLGKPTECPVYRSLQQMGYQENGSGVGFVLVCDIDGDGMAELLYRVGIIYSPIIAYKLVDGVPTEVFRVHTGG